MKGYCKKCNKEIDETEQKKGICFECRFEIPEWMIMHDGITTRRTLK